MTTNLFERETEAVLELRGDIDIAGAAELKEKLLHVLSLDKVLLLDLSTVTRLDVTAIQLLWAAAYKAQQRGRPLRITGDVPEDLREAAAGAGFKEFPEALQTAQKMTGPPMDCAG